MLDKPNKDNVYARPLGFQYTYYLSDCVQDSHEYHELLQLLEQSSEEDLIRLVINNSGGESGTCVQLVDHIRQCRAKVVGVLSGNAYSAAGIIFMACHVQDVAPHSALMIHNAVGYTEGDYHNMAEYVDMVNKRTAGLYKDVFKHFLTEDEIFRVTSGKQFWMCYDEICERLDNRSKLFEEEAKQAEKSLNDMFESLDGDDFGEELPDEVLLKLTKKQLIDYMNGRIVVNVDDNGKISIVEVEENTDSNN
jgi:ATP-dependent protease ClpP protease subunit